MKVALHLISAPWSQPNQPSAQLGCLKAFVDRAFKGEITTTCYSAHLEILYRFKGAELFKYHLRAEKIRSRTSNVPYGSSEFPYLLAIYKDYLRGENSPDIDEVLSALSLGPIDKPYFTENDLHQLIKVTNEYVKEVILPKLDASALNVIGFTMNFDQLFSSLYLERLIRKLAPNHKLLFLYGGYGGTAETCATMLKRFGATGYRVVGEGERKLEQTLSILLDRKTPPPEGFEFGVEGVVSAQGSETMFEKPASFFKSQIENLEELPLPDYDEYFELHRKLKKADPLFAFVENVLISVEGSRGCFAKCDFCSLNAQWRGFRKLGPDQVFDRVQKLYEKYEVDMFFFLDNVCDTWAEAFAERVIASGLKLRLFMELRAHHPESFWTKLSLAGLTSTQIGVEALSEPLLKKIGKGTRVRQNLVVQKCLREHGVDSGSNVIGFHPKSTIEDINETQRILYLTPHFPKLRLVKYWLDADSAIFRSIPQEERENLIPVREELPGEELNGVVVKWGYELPPSLSLKPEVLAGWNEFAKWYHSVYLPSADSGGSLRIHDNKNGSVKIEDTRHGRALKFELQGLAAEILKKCHGSLSREMIEKTIKCNDSLDSVLEDLIKKELLVKLGDFYLTLALRPRSELIQNLEEANQKNLNIVASAVSPNTTIEPSLMVIRSSNRAISTRTS